MRIGREDGLLKQILLNVKKIGLSEKLSYSYDVHLGEIASILVRHYPDFAVIKIMQFLSSFSYSVYQQR